MLAEHTTDQAQISISRDASAGLVSPSGIWTAPCNFRTPANAERGTGAGSPAGHQRRKRDAVGCTVAKGVAAALPASGMANTGTAGGPRAQLRRAQIQRIAENAPCGPDVNTSEAAPLGAFQKATRIARNLPECPVNPPSTIPPQRAESFQRHMAAHEKANWKDVTGSSTCNGHCEVFSIAIPLARCATFHGDSAHRTSARI